MTRDQAIKAAFGMEGGERRYSLAWHPKYGAGLACMVSGSDLATYEDGRPLVILATPHPAPSTHPFWFHSIDGEDLQALEILPGPGS